MHALAGSRVGRGRRSRASASAQELQAVRIGLAEGDDATPTLYAIKNGLFKKYGIDAQVDADAQRRGRARGAGRRLDRHRRHELAAVSLGALEGLAAA